MVVVVAINRTRDDLAGGLEMDSQCCKLEVGLSQLEMWVPEAESQTKERDGRESLSL